MTRMPNQAMQQTRDSLGRRGSPKAASHSSKSFGSQ